MTPRPRPPSPPVRTDGAETEAVVTEHEHRPLSSSEQPGLVVCAECVEVLSEPASGRVSSPKVGLTTAQDFLLDLACRPVRRAFGCSGPYLVGTAAVGSDYRDVDVRTILADDEFDALFLDRERLWDLVCMSVSLYLSNATGLPVDFQIQRMTEANAKHDGPRHALGINAAPADRFAGGGDATPDRCPSCGFYGPPPSEHDCPGRTDAA